MIFLTFLLLLPLFSPPSVGAIIVLPAVILIPLAQLLAVILGAFGVPIAGLGYLVKTLTKNKKLAVTLSLGTFLLTMLISALILKYKYPENPWF